MVKKQVKKVHVRCVNQTGASEGKHISNTLTKPKGYPVSLAALMAEAHKGNLPNDPAFKCFLHCMFEMFGLVRTLQSLIFFTKCNLSSACRSTVSTLCTWKPC